MPQANSATSSPRTTSPRASSRTLPCSAVIRAAIFSLSRFSSSRNVKSTWVRLASEMLPQASAQACLAVATTSPTRSAEARSRSRETAPVAGLNTSLVRSAVPSQGRPAMRWVMRVGRAHDVSLAVASGSVELRNGR